MEEKNKLAKQYPEKVNELVVLMQNSRTENVNFNLFK
jgi:hypothetical protein